MLAHRLLGGSSSSLSSSCLSLGSALLAAARTHLWSSFKQRATAKSADPRNRQEMLRLLLLPPRSLCVSTGHYPHPASGEPVQPATARVSAPRLAGRESGEKSGAAEEARDIFFPLCFLVREERGLRALPKRPPETGASHG